MINTERSTVSFGMETPSPESQWGASQTLHQAATSQGPQSLAELRDISYINLLCTLNILSGTSAFTTVRYSQLFMLPLFDGHSGTSLMLRNVVREVNSILEIDQGRMQTLDAGVGS